jgi:hypothetical protein
MEPEAEHQEVPKEEAAVMLVRGLRKQHRDQKSATECCQKTKERTQ